VRFISLITVIGLALGSLRAWQHAEMFSGRIHRARTLR
jgi:hypothetical protein